MLHFCSVELSEQSAALQYFISANGVNVGDKR